MGKEVESGTAVFGERHTCQSRTAGAFLGKGFLSTSLNPPPILQKLSVKWTRRSGVELPIWENATRAKAAPQVPFWKKVSPSPTSETSNKKGFGKHTVQSLYFICMRVFVDNTAKI